MGADFQGACGEGSSRAGPRASHWAFANQDARSLICSGSERTVALTSKGRHGQHNIVAEMQRGQNKTGAPVRTARLKKMPFL